jgi:hypothetical protein
LKECRYLIINLVVVSWGVLVPLGVVLECPGDFTGCRIARSLSHPSFLSDRRLFKLVTGEIRKRIKEFRHGLGFPFKSFCDPGNLIHLRGIFSQRIEFQGPFTIMTDSPKAELARLFKESVLTELAPEIKPALGLS